MPTRKIIYIYASFLVFIITALFSSGFLHPDEHYQILELLHLKTNNWKMDEILNWDFHEKIRPWFQTSIYYLISLLSPTKDPFILATVFRIFNAMMGFLSLRIIFKYFNENNEEKSFLIFSLIWFVPFMMVRTNSESLSISMFMFAMYFFDKTDSKIKSFLSGLLFGASFLARFQMGIPIFCINVFQLFKDRDIKRFFVHSFGIGLMVALGILIDIWGYGEVNASAWNYFRENIINSRASEFGTSPLWYYLIVPIYKGGVIIPILIWIGIYKYHKEKKVDAWIIAFWSFLLIHSYIPHKELRFISFNYILGTLMAVRYLNLINKKSLITLVIVVNSVFMFRTSFYPANSYIKIYKYLYDSEIKNIYVLSHEGNKGFEFTMPFYQRQRIETRPIQLEEFVYGHILAQKFTDYLLLKNVPNCDVVFTSYPEFVKYLNITGWLDRSSFFSLWNCRK